MSVCFAKVLKQSQAGLNDYVYLAASFKFADRSNSNGVIAVQPAQEEEQP